MNFRASRPPNESQRENAVDWGVYDPRTGRFVSEQIYTREFARKLAAATNYGYKEGMKDAPRSR